MKFLRKKLRSSTFLLPLLAGLFFLSCGRDDGLKNSSPSTEQDSYPLPADEDPSHAEYIYSYRFVNRQCDTGFHQYKELAKYCTALKRQNLNRYCSVSQRYYRFIENCSGQPWQLITNDLPDDKE